VWRKEAIGKDMGMGGVFREVIRPAQLVATEKFDDAWYPGEAVNTTTFEEKSGVTSVRLVVLYESKEARDTASRSGMERGMIAGYNRLEALLASDEAGAPRDDRIETGEAREHRNRSKTVGEATDRRCLLDNSDRNVERARAPTPVSRTHARSSQISRSGSRRARGRAGGVQDRAPRVAGVSRQDERVACAAGPARCGCVADAEIPRGPQAGGRAPDADDADADEGSEDGCARRDRRRPTTCGACSATSPRPFIRTSPRMIPRDTGGTR
jgi:hypothetical protein